MTRVEYIDRLKGFAILCVIAGHFTLWVYGMSTDFLHDFVYLFHMPLFLFLSGIVIGTAPKPSKVVVKAFQFLCPFFIIGSIAYSEYIDGSFQGFMSGQYKYGYWYLFVLTIFYLFLLPFQFTNGKRNTKGIVIDILLSLCIYAILKISVKIIPLALVDTLSLGLICAYWPYFIMGYFTRKYNLTKWLMSKNIVMSLALIFIIPASILYYSGYGHFYNFISLAFIIVLVYIFKLRDNESSFVERELSRLGRNSLNIYVLHYFVIRTIHLEKIGEFLTTTGNILLATLLNICASILIAYIAMAFGKLIQQSNLVQGVVYGNYIKRIIKHT